MQERLNVIKIFKLYVNKCIHDVVIIDPRLTFEVFYMVMASPFLAAAVVFMLRLPFPALSPK